MLLAVNTEEDLPNLAVFVHAVEVERRQAWELIIAAVLSLKALK